MSKIKLIEGLIIAAQTFGGEIIFFFLSGNINYYMIILIIKCKLIRLLLHLINFHKFITGDEDGFCMTILKEENHGLILVNHRTKYLRKKSFWCAKIKSPN